MSEENLNREEIKDIRNDLFTSLGTTLTTEHSKLTQLNDGLESYQKTIDNVQARYEELPEDQQRGFGTALQEIAEEVSDLESPHQVLNTKGRFEAAFENPLLNSVEQQYLGIYDELGIEIGDEAEQEIRGKIRATADSQPEQTLESIESVLESLSELPAPVYSVVQSKVSDNFRDTPAPDSIQSYIQTVRERYKILGTVSRQLSEHEWAPDELEDMHTWEELIAPGPDVELGGLIDEIQDCLQSSPDIIPVEDVVLTELESRLDQLHSEPRTELQEVHDILESILEERETISDIEELREVVDFESLDAGFTSIVTNWQADPPKQLKELHNTVKNSTQQVRTWERELDSQWTQRQRLVKSYADIIGDEPPERVENYLDEDLPVEDNLAKAYEILLSAESWVSSHEEEMVDELSEEAKELFHRLSRTGKYDISENELDPLSELLGVVDIKVVMDE
ncbi:hypothetical protein EGH22_20390 [Halomicroarcula sp. F28]|uniref:hypothetical protein n=1 Tax=Haloarcula salinisoli TaxID=2487746 RepID=UPI001C73D75B|nr:hypothetical protein [Halomicroarcula salinisoli]MBX0288693.1 hypothetical protein [Halomicroarcula salinisoli]